MRLTLPMLWRRNNKATRRASWLALFAILFQALLPAVHHPASFALEGQANTAPAGAILAGLDLSQYLCLSPGSTAPNKPDKAPQHHSQPCALCVVMHSIGGFPPSAVATVAIDRDYVAFSPAVASFSLPSQRPSFRQQPRGPPSLA